MSNENIILSVKICNEQPLELIDYTDCLMGIGQQYIRHLQKNPEQAESKDIRLYVKEFRPGSIIADLVPYAPVVLPVVQDTASIVAFTLYMQSFINFLLGKEKKPENLDKQDYEQMNKIAQPVANDNSSQFNLTLICNGEVKNEININSLEANAMQNKIYKDLKRLKEPTEKIYKKVVLYWHQARGDLKSKAGDQAKIESISSRPLKTIFAIDDLKHEMLVGAEENPFLYAFVVDVALETIQERPAAYKIIEYHEKFRKPFEENEHPKLFD